MLASQAINPNTYYDLDIYKEEQRKVFHENWIFVGFKEQIKNHDDFITTKIGETPVVIQNCNGELHALLNICSHRKATLQTAACGNRPLRCPYHCWTYKNGGKLIGIPQNIESFAINEQQKEKLSLKQFNIAYCGDFIFVRINRQGKKLEDFLGPYFNILNEISADFCQDVFADKYRWQTNWKLAVETVLEVYHVPGTHPESFANLAIPECEIISNPPHSTGNTPMQEPSKKWWQGVRKFLKLQQNLKFTEYNHIFIYPNLAIGITNGSLMSVQTYEPKSENTCDLNFRLKMIKTANQEKTSDVVRQEIYQNLTRFNHVTLEEDRIVAESCQDNMPHTKIPAIIGKCEDRIRHFHNAWRLNMEIAQTTKEIDYA